MIPRKPSINLYSIDYLRKAIAVDSLPLVDKDLAGDDFEALESVRQAHLVGGPDAAYKFLHSMLRDYRPELYHRFVMQQGLYVSTQLGDIPQRHYLLDDYPLYEKGFNLLVGPRGGGKSFFCVDIVSRAGQRGITSLYIAAEGVDSYHPRLTGWHHYHNHKQNGHIHLYSDPVQTTGERWQSFVDYIVKPVKPQLIIIDTVARCMVGMDENSTRDMSLFVEKWDEIRKQFECALLFVHHTNRANTQRGSSVLDAAADSVMVLYRTEEIITLRNDMEAGGKNKNRKEAAPLAFIIEGHEVPGEFEGEDATGVLVPGELHTIHAGDYELKSNEAEIVAALAGVDAGFTANEVAGMVTPSSATVYRTLKRLLDRGFVDKQVTNYVLTEEGQKAADKLRYGKTTDEQTDIPF